MPWSPSTTGPPVALCGHLEVSKEQGTTGWDTSLTNSVAPTDGEAGKRTGQGPRVPHHPAPPCTAPSASTLKAWKAPRRPRLGAVTRPHTCTWQLCAQGESGAANASENVLCFLLVLEQRPSFQGLRAPGCVPDPDGTETLQEGTCSSGRKVCGFPVVSAQVRSPSAGPAQGCGVLVHREE